MKDKFLFEISWEVCNKVGGIHTVVTSKLFEAQRNFSNYICVGPYKNQSSEIFDELDLPEQFKEGAKQLEELGINIHYGTWNVEGFPETILVDIGKYSQRTNECKGQLWNLWEVDSLGTQWFDFDEPFIWSWVCGIVIEKLTSHISNDILVHAHEWMSGGALAYLSTTDNLKFRKIFTTHATMLGRTLFGSGGSLKRLEEKSADELAEELGIKTKFQMERALACNSDCFTTVSDITAQEAELIYGKKPDVITYNGFDSQVDDIYTLEKQFMQSRNEINGFLMKYFYDFFNYSSQDTYLMFTSGRYELRNKGIDVIVKALAQLNEKLKESNSSKKVIFWFMLMFGKYDLDEKVGESMRHAKAGTTPQHLGYGPLSPYALPLDNELVRLLVTHHLVNNESSPVKVIVTPTNFDGNDGLVNMEYYHLTSGFDLGVFPSLYEPWGYTPAEALAYGVPAVSSDLCGVGQKACEFYCDESFQVIQRKDVEDDEVVSQLADLFYHNISSTPKEQLRKKIQAKICSQKFSWRVFYSHYLEAYKHSVEHKA